MRIPSVVRYAKRLIATYLGDLILNQGPNKVARLVGLLAALFGIIVIAATKGWLTSDGGGIFDD